MPYIGKQPEHGRFAKLDQINTGFNGSATTFNLTVDTVAVYPTNPQNLLVSIGGVIQQPGTDYTVSAATLTLTSAPAASTDFFGVLLGDVLDIGTPSDGSVTVSKMAANSVDSAQYVDGSIDTVHIDALQITGAKIAANTITGDKIALGSDAQGDVMYYNGTDWVRLGFGTDGHFLKTQGTGANPVWAAGGGIASVLADTTPQLGGNLDMQARLLVGNGGSTGIAISANGEVTMAAQPAFHALDSSANANQTGSSGTYTVTFETEVFDQNSDFATPTFTAPVTGRYLIAAMVHIDGVTTSAGRYNMSIVTSNRTYQNLVDFDAAFDGVLDIPYTVIADMDAADTATITIAGTGEGSNVWDIGVVGHFSGVLLA